MNRKNFTITNHPQGGSTITGRDGKQVTLPDACIVNQGESVMIDTKIGIEHRVNLNNLTEQLHAAQQDMTQKKSHTDTAVAQERLRVLQILHDGLVK